MIIHFVGVLQRVFTEDLVQKEGFLEGTVQVSCTLKMVR